MMIPPKLPLKTILKIGVSLALLAFFLTQSGIGNTLNKLSHANLWYLPLGVLIFLICQGISAYRWQFLSAALGFRLSFREFYDYYLMGMFFNLFLPGAIGGDVCRVMTLSKRTSSRVSDAVLTVLAERGVGLVALMIFTGILCLTPLTEPIPSQLRSMILGMSGLGILGFLVLQVFPLLVQRIRFLEILDRARVYWQDLPLLFKSVSISLVVQAGNILIHLMIAQAMGVSVSPGYLTAVYGIAALASVLPISFNGIGVREGIYVSLLGRVGIAQPTALAFALYWFLVSSLTSLIGGLVLLKGPYQTPGYPVAPKTARADEPSSVVTAGSG